MYSQALQLHMVKRFLNGIRGHANQFLQSDSKTNLALVFRIVVATKKPNNVENLIDIGMKILSTMILKS